MTATTTQVSLAHVVSEKEWVKIFPKQITENYTSSVTFIKQLTSLAVSCITYFKNAFPEECYHSEVLGGLKMKILNNKCDDELAQFLSTALNHAFEAFDKNYIRQLALCFYENDRKPENLLEFYIFEYSYNSEGVVLNINTKKNNNSMKCTLQNIKERTKMLMRTLSVYLVQLCQQELPANYDITLRLYYNEAAPPGYQAPGFARGLDADGGDHVEASLSEAIRLGWVQTPFHKFVALAYVKDTFPASHEAVATQNTPLMTQTEKDGIRGSQSEHSNGECSGKCRTARPRLQCPCNKYHAVDPPLSLITCQSCRTQQHAVCFGVLKVSEEVSRRHYCTACTDEHRHLAPTDRMLAGLEEKKRECFCTFRRALALCAAVAAGEGGALSARGLAARLALSPGSAARLLCVLQRHRVLGGTPDQHESTPQKVDGARLRMALDKFFSSVPDNLIERLLVEVAESRNDYDPVGDMLTPMQKMSLQNSQIVKIIDRPVCFSPSDISENSTLSQYREIILSCGTNEELGDELPLSGSHNPVKDLHKIGKRSYKRNFDDHDYLGKSSGQMTKKVRFSS